MISFENVMMYCSGDITKIENYEIAVSDKNNVWDCHHRRALKKDVLERHNLYYGVPPNELIFLKHTDHFALHRDMWGEKPKMKDEDYKCFKNTSDVPLEKNKRNTKNNVSDDDRTFYVLEFLSH